MNSQFNYMWEGQIQVLRLARPLIIAEANTENTILLLSVSIQKEEEVSCSASRLHQFHFTMVHDLTKTIEEKNL